MAEQGSFEVGGFDKYHKPTRRERFLSEMEKAVPWAELLAVMAAQCDVRVVGLRSLETTPT